MILSASFLTGKDGFVSLYFSCFIFLPTTLFCCHMFLAADYFEIKWSYLYVKLWYRSGNFKFEVIYLAINVFGVSCSEEYK